MSTNRSSGSDEQRQLNEDPVVLKNRNAEVSDQAADRAVEERERDHLRQAFHDWWSGLGADEAMHYRRRRDELMLLLHEKYRYTRDDASREADRVLGAAG